MPLLFLASLLFTLGFSSPARPDSQFLPNSTSRSTLLVLGDSLSAAYNISAESGWVHLLQQRLEEAGKNVSVVNGSVSGATTAAGLQSLPAILERHQPDYMILELGANDGLQGKPVPYIKQNLVELISLAKSANVKVLLVGIRLPPNFGSRYTEPFFNQYADLASQYELEYLPFLLDGVAGNDELMQEDGLHPTAKAQPKILDNIWPAVNALIQTGD